MLDIHVEAGLCTHALLNIMFNEWACLSVSCTPPGVNVRVSVPVH